LVFRVLEIEVIVNVVQDNRVVTGIEDRTLSLDSEGALELIVAHHIGQIEKDVAFNPLIVAEFIIRPCGIIHELSNCGLHGLENLFIGSWYFTGYDLNITP
jgi:hypothetical protein